MQKGDRVAVVLDGTVHYLVAFYGALLAGAAAVPMCPDLRTGTLVWTLEHAEVRAVVMDAANLRYLDRHLTSLPNLRLVLTVGRGVLEEPAHVRVGALEDEISAASPGAAFEAAPNDLAAIVYTSGTTGHPKGVMLSHENLTSNTRSIVSYLGLREADTTAMLLPYFYVYGNSVLHTHLAASGTIAQLGSMTFLGPVFESMVEYECTTLSGVPSTFARLLSSSQIDEYDLSRLRLITQAGAAASKELLTQLTRALPQARLFVMYGQTEASARLSYLPPEDLERKLGSAGKAIPGVTLKVCDPEGHELPRGQVGEIVAQGANVMLGYFHNPEATARVLRPEGLRTGDLAFMDEEGYLFIQGRQSEFIKSGGHRISPARIEEVLSHCPSIKESAACGVPDPLLGERVVAYVVAHEGRVPTKQELLKTCHEELPKFKVPNEFWLVESLPYGPTGKLKRRELVSWYEREEGKRIT